MAQPYEEGGITGGLQGELVKRLQGLQAPGMQPPAGDVPPVADAPAAAPGLSTQYRGQLGGFDTGKLDAGKNDPKYVFAKYAQGLNVADPNDRAKLQGLLRGDPSGFFKNATLDGDMLHGAYDPATGRSGDVDVIKGLKAGGQGWQWGAVDPTAPTSGPIAAPSGGSPLSLLQGMLGGSGSAQGNIQQALGAVQQPGILQQLIAQLQGAK